MSSHTARYASVVALWYGISGDPIDREEARVAFALSTYSAYNIYSKNGMAVNYVGIDYEKPRFSDSYWDYLNHYFDGMSELPEMLPENENHLFYSSSVITDISYTPDKVVYQTFDAGGSERLKLIFEPIVYADGKLLDHSQWMFGEFHGVPGVLHLNRTGAKHIVIKAL